MKKIIMIKTKNFNQITTTKENVRLTWQSCPSSQFHYPWAFEKDNITASTPVYTVWCETVRPKVLHASIFKETKLSALMEC